MINVKEVLELGIKCGKKTFGVTTMEGDNFSFSIEWGHGKSYEQVAEDAIAIWNIKQVKSIRFVN